MSIAATMRRLFKKKHIHKWVFDPHLITGKGKTTAYHYRCKCGKMQVRHSGGTFELD